MKKATIQDVKKYLINIYKNDNNNSVVEAYGNFKKDFYENNENNFYNLVLNDTEFLEELLNNEDIKKDIEEMEA